MRAIKVTSIITIGVFIWFMANKYYFNPMKELNRDRIILQGMEAEHNKSVVKANAFESKESKQKRIMEEINDELQIKDVGTDFSDGEHTISF